MTIPMVDSLCADVQIRKGIRSTKSTTTLFIKQNCSVTGKLSGRRAQSYLFWTRHLGHLKTISYVTREGRGARENFERVSSPGKGNVKREAGLGYTEKWTKKDVRLKRRRTDIEQGAMMIQQT